MEAIEALDHIVNIANNFNGGDGMDAALCNSSLECMNKSGDHNYWCDSVDHVIIKVQITTLLIDHRVILKHLEYSVFFFWHYC